MSILLGTTAPGEPAGKPAGTEEGSAGGSSSATPPSRPAQSGRTVRDRDVVLLSAAIVVAVLAVQGLTILFPALNDAIGRPPTVIIFLVVVTLAVMVRVVLAMLRQR